MKKLLSIILSITMILTMSATALAAENATSDSLTTYFADELVTVDSYKHWLSASNIEGSIDSTNQQAQILAEFESLTSDEQQQFVTYLNDEELMSDVMNSFLNGPETITFVNGDISVDTINDIALTNTRATESTTKATHTRTVQFFNIDIVKVSNYVTYTHTSSTITDIIRGGMVTGHNYAPFLGISYSNHSEYIQSNRAYHVADLSCEFLYEGSGIVYGSAEFGVYGTPSKSVGWWVTPYLRKDSLL